MNKQIKTIEDDFHLAKRYLEDVGFNFEGQLMNNLTFSRFGEYIILQYKYSDVGEHKLIFPIKDCVGIKKGASFLLQESGRNFLGLIPFYH